MFIYHGCDNLKHIFSDFIRRSVIQPVIELVLKMFRFPALLISYGISFYILITLALGYAQYEFNYDITSFFSSKNAQNEIHT